MATATITETPDVRLNTNYDLQSFLARGGKMEMGTILFDGGTYLDGGIAFTPKIGATRLFMVILLPADADGGGRVYSYDYTNNMIQVYEAGADAAELDELENSDTMSETLKYLAIGF